ncbi:MAG: hypothetical protein R3C19_00575 [Planctomycetaceae bacterium]
MTWKPRDLPKDQRREIVRLADGFEADENASLADALCVADGFDRACRDELLAELLIVYIGRIIARDETVVAEQIAAGLGCNVEVVAYAATQRSGMRRRRYLQQRLSPVRINEPCRPASPTAMTSIT